MQLIIPLSRMRDTLVAKMDAHAKRYNYEHYGKLSQFRLNEILCAVVEDYVAQNLKHAPIIDNFEAVIGRFFPYWNRESIDLFMCEVRDDIEGIAAEYFDGIFPQYEWSCWTLQMHGFDILATIGEDWRVRDWRERIQRGEIHVDFCIR